MHLYVRQGTVRESTGEKMPITLLLMIQIPKKPIIRIITLFPMQILLIGASPWFVNVSSIDTILLLYMHGRLVNLKHAKHNETQRRTSLYSLVVQTLKHRSNA